MVKVGVAMKKTVSIIFCIAILLCMGITAVACGSSDYTDIKEITVDPSIDPNENPSFTGFSVSNFSIEQITLVVKHKNTTDGNGNEVEGTVTTMQAADYMLRAEDREKITKPGTNEIILVYGKFRIPYILKLYDDVSGKYVVTFYAEDGTTRLGDIQRVNEGGRAEQPQVPAKDGYEFVGWIDMDTEKSTTFDNIRKNTRLRAAYVAKTYTVRYYYRIGEEEIDIEEKTLDYDQSGEDFYPEAPQLEGYDFLNWTRESNERFYAEYQPTAYKIEFVYRKYSGTKYSDTFSTETVSYSADDSYIVPPSDYVPSGNYGLSKANDYQFAYWYASRNGKAVKVEFPLAVTNMYETSFTAFYIDINKGNDELVYKRSADGCIVSGYEGTDDVIVIPTTTVLSDGGVYPVTGIGEGAFKSVSIKQYVVSGENAFFSTKNGVLYSKDGSVLYAYPTASEATSYTVEEGTAEISAYAFNKAEHLTGIVLNETLSLIDNFAFMGCKNLEAVEISKNVRSIGEGAFKMKNGGNIRTITFTGTEIVTIGDEAFYGLNALTELILPASLTGMGDGVFYGCGQLKRVNADRNINFVEKQGAVYSADMRTLYVYPAQYPENDNPEFILDENCSNVMRGAFYHANITCITLSADTSLSPYCIICPALKSIRIDNTGYAYDENQFKQAFSDYLPEVVYVKEGTASFDGVEIDGVEIVHYDEWTYLPDYFNDYAFSWTEEGAVIEAYNGTSRALILPTRIGDRNVVKIASNAFNGNETITSVEIPNFVQNIDENAFMNCTQLSAVIIHTNEDIPLEIMDRAFYGCSSLTSVTFPRNAQIKAFGEYVFDRTPIPDGDGFVIVGNVLIAYNGSDREITVPANVTYIATDAFKDCGQIVSVNFAQGSRLETVDSFAFLNCIGIQSISFPATIRQIFENAFYGCDYLYCVKYATREENVSVSENAYYQAGGYYNETIVEEFSDSSKGEINYHIEISTVRKEGLAFVEALDSGEYNEYITTNNRIIGWFYDKAHINEAIFPLRLAAGQTLDLYARIVDEGYVSGGLVYSRNDEGTYTVIGYTGTDMNVIMPERYMSAEVVGIAENAFGERVVEISMPHRLNMTTSRYVSQIVSIGIDAFTQTALYKKTAGDFVIYDNILIGYKGDAHTVIIPDSVSILADGVFKNNKSIEYVVLPSTISRIPLEAFSGCSSLKKVVLGEGVSVVEEKAFYDCAQLQDINFDETPTLSEIAGDALENTAWLRNYDGDCVIINSILYKYFGSVSKLHVPSGISDIAESAFAGNAKLSKIYLPSSLRVIRENAFANAIALRSVYIPTGTSSLAYIMEGAFKNCYNLSEFDLKTAEQLSGIGDYAFENTSVFRDLYISASLLMLGSYAFRNSGVRSVTVADSSRMATIQDGAFYQCRSLESVVFMGNNVLSTIGKYAFYECTSLKKFRNSVASIKVLDDYAFYNCKDLVDVSINENALITLGNAAVENMGYVSAKNNDMVLIGNILIAYKGTAKRVTVPASVTLIYDEAFAGNTEITEVIFEGNALKKINDRAFYGCSSLAKIDFPASVDTVGYNVMYGTQWYTEKLNTEEFITINNTLIKYNGSYPKQAVIPESVTKIIRGAFSNTSVYDIKIGENVQLIEDGAFDGIVPAQWQETVRTKDEEGNRCSELYERNIAGDDGIGVSVKYDDCNPFGMIAGDFGDITSLSKHTTRTASGFIISAFNSLSELFAAFMANFEIPTDGTEYIPPIGSKALKDYTSFYDAATKLYNGSLVSFTKNISNNLARSAVIGVNHPYTMAFGTDVSPERINFQTVIANLFGFSSKTEFMNYAKNLASTYVKYKTDVANSTAVNKALENGCFYTTNGSFVFPIAVKNDLSSTVLAYVIIDAAGLVSVWVNDITAALWATNFNEDYHTDSIIENELYCKNVLFVTGQSEEEADKITMFSGWTLTITATSPMRSEYETAFPNCVAIYLQTAESYAEFALDSDWFVQLDIVKVIQNFTIRYSVIEGEATSIEPEQIHALYNAKEVNSYKTTSKQFVFVGWFLDEDFTHALTYPFILTSNTTIYAKCVDYDEGSNPAAYQLEDSEDSSGQYTIVDYLDRTDKHVVLITKQAGKTIYSITGHLGYIMYSGEDKDRYIYDEEEQEFKPYDMYQNYPEGTRTYARNTTIEEINFANNCTIEVLGENAFSGMTNLERVVIPASVKRICANAFADCVNLREVVIDGDVRGLTIETGAFRNCVSLQRIVLPEGVTGLENEAFVGCTGLKEVYFESDTPIVLYEDAHPFEILAELKLYVPHGRKSAYSSNWQYYYDYLTELPATENGDEQ